MKYPAIIFALFVLMMTASAQEIKKWKIGDLQAYIQHSDHPLVVNFWATYCGPCVQEIPYFQSTVAKYKGAELLLVSLDLPDYYPQKIDSFAKDKHFTAPIAWLNETNADEFCPKIDPKWSGAIPSSLFVNNKTGHRRFFERALSRGEVEENMKALLGE